MTFNLAERLKVNLDLWNLFIDIVSLGFTYQVRIMTGFNSIQKSTFQKKSHLKALEGEFDLMLSRSSQPRINI